MEEKKHYAKKGVLVEKLAKGGLKMPRAGAGIISIKLNFLAYFKDREAFFPQTDNVTKFLKYKSNTTFLHPLPKFYEQLLDMWYSLNNCDPTTINEILSESIWLSERIIYLLCLLVCFFASVSLIH